MSPEYLLQVFVFQSHDPRWVKTGFRVTSICQRFMSFKEVDNMHRQAKIRKFMSPDYGLLAVFLFFFEYLLVQTI